MDKNLPYNELEQFNDLSLPDAEQSWQGMKKLLDEDEDNRKPVVPLFLKTCAGWGFFLLLAGALTWYLLQPDAESKPSQTVATKPSTSTLPATSRDKKNHATPTTKSTLPIPESTASGKSNSTNSNEPGINNTNHNNIDKNLTLKSQDPSEVHANMPVLAKANTKTQSSTTPDQNKTTAKNPNTATKKRKETTGSSNDTPVPLVTKTNPDKQQVTPMPADGKQVNSGTNSNNTPTDSAALSMDSAARVVQAIAAPDSANKLDTAAVVQQKKTKPSLVLNGGIGLQQQVPFGDQKAVPYDYYGRKSSVYDYIPSLYVRLEKEGKWFVQGEFRYGAPQSMKELAYSRQTRVDTTNIFLTTTSFRLKKTYYHQLPLSFNYYIMPNWSVGAGGIYSRFYGAVTEKEVRNLNVQTQAETVSRQIVNIKQFTDSFLYKTQLHFLLQTEYHWKRFTIGARYTMDAQPFIKYTRPDGRVDAKKNQTIQLMAKFRLFRAKL